MRNMTTRENLFTWNQTDLRRRLSGQTQSQISEFIDRQDIRCVAKDTEPLHPTKKSDDTLKINQESTEQHHRHITTDHHHQSHP